LIAVDTNILVYAHRNESPWHESAKSVIRALVEEVAVWAIPWPCIHEFLTVVTNPKIHRPPTPMRLALDQVDAWLESGRIVFIGETERHWEVLGSVLLGGAALAAQVHDGRIAAICLQHGVSEFWTADRDFSRFPALKVRNPLVG